MDMKKVKLLEYLMVKGDIEGMMLLISGLTRELEQQYIDTDINDYEKICKRI